MSTQTATIQLRIDSKTKRQAQGILAKLGLDLSSATKLFLSQVIKTKSIPFIAHTENGYTPEYERILLRELKRMEQGDEKTFTSVKALMDDLQS